MWRFKILNKNRKTLWLRVIVVFVIFIFLAFFSVSVFDKNQKEQVKGIKDDRKEQVKRKIQGYNGLILSKEQKIKNKKLSVSEKKEIKEVLIKRKDILLKEVETSPYLMKESALPKQVVDSLSEEEKGLVEQEVEIKGKLKVLIADDFKNKKSTTSYKLEDTKKYNVKFIEEPQNLKSSEEVTAKGLALDTTLVLDSGESPSLSINAPPRKALTGAQDTLVVRFNWNNDTSEPFSAADIDAQLYSGANSTNLFYQENSYSQLSFPGDTSNVTTNWYTIPYNKNSGCSDSNITNWTVAAYNAAKIDYPLIDVNYDNLIFLFPDNLSCGWAGLGEVGGPITWINGYNNSSLYSHELGHNIGEGHASYKDCGTKSIDSYANCYNSEYGDDYDVMGGSWENYHYNASFKDDAGWIPPGEIQTVSTNGTYTLNTLESAGSAIKAIKIQKPDTGEYYWLEYRQAAGFDNTLSAGVTRGLIVHVFNGVSGDNSYLLDMTPATGWSDVALSDGTTFTDTINSISITQTSHDGSSVTLSVDFTVPPPPPTVSPVYRFYNISNGTHFYTASAAERDNVGARWGHIYRYEGVVYNLTDNGQNIIQLYRFRHKNGTHFYTNSPAERDNIVRRWPGTYTYEGVAYYVAVSGTPVYRFYNISNGTHFYTASATERDNVGARWGHIYRYEGTAFYVQ